MRGDWRDFRPAIWLTMLGIAVMLLVSPFYLGAVFIGAGIGAAIRIRQRRHRVAAAARPAVARPGRRGAATPAAPRSRRRRRPKSGRG